MKPYENPGDAVLRQQARALDASGDYRVLRRLPNTDEIWLMPTPAAGVDVTLGIIDCETTGLTENDHVVEIALAKLCLVAGQVADLTEPMTMLEDPGRPLSNDIQRITGLTDADLDGRVFDECLLQPELDDVDALVAFNAKFDAGHLRRRFPRLTHPWICARADYDWSAAGHHGRGQEALLTGLRHFYDVHGAAPDVRALLVLIAQPAWDGRTVAAHLVDRERQLDARISAGNAPFGVKNQLKGRGYRWNATRRVWSIDVSAATASDEVDALAEVHPRIVPKSGVREGTENPRPAGRDQHHNEETDNDILS